MAQDKLLIVYAFPGFYFQEYTSIPDVLHTLGTAKAIYRAWPCIQGAGYTARQEHELYDLFAFLSRLSP